MKLLLLTLASMFTLNCAYSQTVSGWDAAVTSQYTNGSTTNNYHLIGTYQGWDPGGVYIAGYNYYNNSSLATKRIYMGSLFENLQTGNIGIGTTATPFLFNISRDISMTQDVDAAQLSITGASDNGKRIIIGYDVNGGGFGYIKAGWYTHQWTNLSLQPNGGNVGIGTTSPDQKLTVNGTVHATQVLVTANAPTPDYVFDKSYRLRPLSEVKAYVDHYHHLPEVASAKEMAKHGVDVNEMNMKLLQKVEEMTLYMIELKKENESLKRQQTSQRRVQQQIRLELKKALNHSDRKS